MTLSPSLGTRYAVTYRKSRDSESSFVGTLTNVLPRSRDSLFTFRTKTGPRMVPSSFVVAMEEAR